jgi:tRNA pseudouridine55 synthase
MSAIHAWLPRRRVNGVLLLDKPPGLSSNAALQRAKRLYAAEKAGHTGTLDPLASGLLPICFGEATKFAQGLLDAHKIYDVSIRFGVATTTGDAEGDVVAERPITFDRTQFDRILPQFLGAIAQVPPRYAALKFQGRNYYEYARAGVEIPRLPRQVQIDSIDVLTWTPPVAALRVACGKGTYVRVLAEELAAAVGCCAHLIALRRISTGTFGLDHAVTLDALEALDVEERDALLLPIYSPLAQMPTLNVDIASVRALCQGRLAPSPAGAAGRYCCFGAEEQSFLGVVEVDGDGMRAIRLVRSAPAEEQNAN